MVIVARGHLQIHGKHNTISKTVYIYKLEGQYHTTGKEAAANAAEARTAAAEEGDGEEDDGDGEEQEDENSATVRNRHESACLSTPLSIICVEILTTKTRRDKRRDS